MATKTKKTSAKKPAAKMRDLPTRKNPKGGAQKKETDGGGTNQTTGKSTFGLGAGRRQVN